MDPNNLGQKNNGWYEYRGITSFVTDATTLELHIPFKKIKSIYFTMVDNGLDPDAPPSCDEPVVGSGDAKLIDVPSDGNITIARNAGGLSGASFAFYIIGR